MADPIVEQIAQVIESRLQGVTTAAGYNQNLTVIRPTRMGLFSVKNNLAILKQGNPRPNDELSNNGIIPGNPPSQEWLQEFSVMLLSRASEKSTEAAETLVNRLWADAKQAITRFGETDAATWDKFGVLARESVIGESEIGIWEDDAATAAIEIVILVKYRIVENDPYTSG